jgi:hypothetical protein
MKIHAIAVFASFLLLSLRSSSQPQEDSADLRVFEKAEIEAAYPGGFEAWKKFLERNLNPNIPIDNGAPAGVYTVYIQFIVGKDGKVTDFKALTNEGYGMEAEVIRILKHSGDWQPAIQNGKKVNAYRKQPVTFQVIDDNLDFSPYTIVAGEDNEVTINADKVKSEDLNVTISRGTIKPNGPGKYIVHVTGPARVMLTVWNKKKNKQIGIASLAVRAK